MTPFRIALAVALALATVWTVSAPARAGGTAVPHSDIIIRDAWARATPAGAKNGAIYLTLESTSGDRLVGAEVPRSLAASTEIHETIVLGDSSGAGRMTMRQVAFLDLPRGEAVKLEPGGYHIMLLDLKKPLKSGEHVKVTLVLEKAGKRKATASVRAGS